MGPAFTPALPTGDGTLVYVYRPAALAVNGKLSEFSMDDGQVIRLNSDGYSYVVVRPGKHVLKQRWIERSSDVISEELIGSVLFPKKLDEEPPLKIEFVAIRGDVDYFRLGTTSELSMKFGYLKRIITWELRGMHENDAMAEISQTRYQSPLTEPRHLRANGPPVPNSDAVPIDSLMGLMPGAPSITTGGTP